MPEGPRTKSQVLPEAEVPNIGSSKVKPILIAGEPEPPLKAAPKPTIEVAMPLLALLKALRLAG